MLTAALIGLATVLVLMLFFIAFLRFELDLEKSSYEASRRTIDSLFAERDAIIADVAPLDCVPVGELPGIVKGVIDGYRLSRDSFADDNRTLSTKLAASRAARDFLKADVADLKCRVAVFKSALDDARAERDAEREAGEVLAKRAETVIAFIGGASSDLTNAVQILQGTL